MAKLKNVTYLHRPFLMLFQEKISNNYLTFYRNHLFSVADEIHVSPQDLELMVFLYPLEFFSRNWVKENYRCTQYYIMHAFQRLKKGGYIELIAGRGTHYEVDGETRVLDSDRIQLTSKGRNAVRKLYREINKGQNAPVPKFSLRYFYDERRF
jgi:hypothetical protein